MRVDNIKLEKMESSDWTFLWSLVNDPRLDLDDEIDTDLQKWQAGVEKEEKKKKEAKTKQGMEAATEGVEQLRIGKKQKSKK